MGMMKWEPVFANLLQFLLDIDRVKKKRTKQRTPMGEEGEPNNSGKDHSGQNINITSIEVPHKVAYMSNKEGLSGVLIFSRYRIWT